MLTPGMHVKTTYTQGENVKGVIIGAYRWSVTIENEKTTPDGKKIVTSHHERWIRPIAGGAK